SAPARADGYQIECHESPLGQVERRFSKQLHIETMLALTLDDRSRLPLEPERNRFAVHRYHLSRKACLLQLAFVERYCLAANVVDQVRTSDSVEQRRGQILLLPHHGLRRNKLPGLGPSEPGKVLVPGKLPPASYR